MDHNEEPLRISGVGEAMAAAFGIRDRFRRAHGAALLDGDGVVLDLTVFTAKHHSIETALQWAGCALASGAHRRPDRIILYSAVRRSVADELREADIELLRRARARFAGAGVRVVDWLQCDGKVVRSIDLASDGTGWHDEASVA